MRKINLSMTWKIVLSIIIVLIVLCLIYLNNQKYEAAQAYNFCYSEMNTTEYMKCYTKDNEGNYAIDNNVDNTKIIYDTNNNIKYYLSDNNIIKQSEMKNNELDSVDDKAFNIFKSTGLDATTLQNGRENKQIESADFTANEQYIIMNYFPEINEADVTSMEYKLDKNILTITENNKDNTSNFITMSVLKNSDVPMIEIPN